MFYGVSSKAKNQICSYIIKQPSKHKHNMSKKTGVTFIQQDKDISQSSLNTFRKNISKEKQSHKRYKTSKNSPNRSFKSNEYNKEYKKNLKEIPEKIICNNNEYHHKNITPNPRIRDNSNADNLFMKKIHKIHTKGVSFNGMNQLTNSNLFICSNNNNNSKHKLHLETSFHKYQLKSNNNIKRSNISLTKKNINLNEIIDTKYQHNGISKQSTSFLDNSKLIHNDKQIYHSDIKKIHHHNKSMNKILTTSNNVNVVPYHKHNMSNNVNNYYQLNRIKSANVSKSKSKQKGKESYTSSSSNMNNILSKSNQQLLIKYGNGTNVTPSHNTNTNSSNLFIQYDKLISSSNPNIKFDFKKINKTSYTTANNSRTNSAEKKEMYSNHLNNINDNMKNNNIRLNKTNLIKSYGSSKQKNYGIDKNKPISVTALKKSNGQISTSYSNININNYINNTSNLNSLDVSSSTNVNNVNGSSNNISNIQNGLYSINMYNIKETNDNMYNNFNTNNNTKHINKQKNNISVNKNYSTINLNTLLKSSQLNTSYKTNINKSDIQHIDLIPSNNNSNSFINGNYNNNLNNKDNNVNQNFQEKDYLYTKVQSLSKHKKSFSSIQSKQNSKSSSHIHDYSFPNYNTQKQSDNIKPSNPIIHNHSTSPLGKSNMNQSKNQLTSIFDITDNYQKENIYIKPNNDFSLLDKMLNESNDSLQSTIRESLFYRKEKEKISHHIKQHYALNGEYPSTKIHFYKYGRIVGKGAFGKVNIALHVCSGKLVAIKSFNKKKLKSKHSLQKIQYEIEILKKLKHIFITQILDTFETENHLLIVMEYICGDLASFIRKRSKIPESSAKIIFKQIIEGLKYIHQNNIVHRDIKPDNILIDLRNTVKIADFGVSRKISYGDIMKDHCGTPAYIAPEIFLNKGYEGFSCDIWSAGVTLYYLLAGVQPFKGKDLSDLKRIIKIGKYNKIDKISSEASDLIDRMLTFDPKKRIQINQILNHPWLVNVNVNNRMNIDLFTMAEKIHLAKYEVDYLNGTKEELIENFTLKNLETINDKSKKHGYTKSKILAPYNSIERKKSSLCSNGIDIENENIKFRGPAKQANIKYELENNKDFDNGMMITKREGEEQEKEEDGIDISNGNSVSIEKCISPMNEVDNYNYLSNDIIEKKKFVDNIIISDKVVKEIERDVGYNRKYLIECIRNNEINYATATYYLKLKEL